MEPKIPDLDKKLATKVSKAAASYKPKFAIPPPVVSLESVAIDFLEELPEGMPRSLSERLRIVAKTQLACFLGNPNIQPKQLEFTTTDIDSAVEVAAVVANGPKGKQAVISMVACETERQMTWSRLEGLKSHWAISSAPGGRWEIPSRNFISVPGGSVNVDGAYNSKFDKHPLPQPGGVVSPDSMFTLLLALPLEGHVADGGLVFVLKSGSEGQNTRWLKDSKTGKDFFIEIKKLPNA